MVELKKIGNVIYRFVLNIPVDSDLNQHFEHLIISDFKRYLYGFKTFLSRIRKTHSGASKN